MGIDLAAILGIMGTAWTGNPLSLNPGFSIGGTVASDSSDNILGNILGLAGTIVVSPDFVSHMILTLAQVILEVSEVRTIGLSRTLLSRGMTYT
jgi:hypothetical protein